MKMILLEPFLIVMVSLFWIIVLPFAAIYWAGITISEKVEAYVGGGVIAGWRARAGFRPGARPSTLA